MLDGTGRYSKWVENVLLVVAPIQALQVVATLNVIGFSFLVGKKKNDYRFVANPFKQFGYRFSSLFPKRENRLRDVSEIG